MSFIIRLLVFIFIAYGSRKVSGKCEKSIVVTCDTVNDVKEYDNRDRWVELWIQSSNDNVTRQVLTSYSLPHDLYNLHRLVIIGQFDKIENFKSILQYTNINELFLHHNNFQIIKAQTFAYQNLKKISLQNNNIRHFQTKTFESLTVKILDLSHNKLTEINTRHFVKCSVKKLVFSYNNLELIEPESFPNDTQKLFLDHNNLIHLESNVFSNLKELTDLSLSHNKLSSLFDVFQLPQLRIFDVSFNEISILDEDFRNSTYLEFLNLEGNGLQTFDLIQFNDPERIYFKVNLAFNALTDLKLPKKKTAEQNPSIYLTLYGNPWNCKCLDTIETALKKFQYKIFRSTCDISYFSAGLPVCLSKDKCDTDFDLVGSYDEYKKFNKTVNYLKRCTFKELTTSPDDRKLNSGHSRPTPPEADE